MPSMPNLQHVRHWGLSWLITQAFVCPTQHHEWQPSAFHWRQKLGQIRPKWGQCKQPMLNGTACQCIQIIGHVDDPLVAITGTNILVSCLKTCDLQLIWRSGSWWDIKMPSWYRKPHCRLSKKNFCSPSTTLGSLWFSGPFGHFCSLECIQINIRRAFLCRNNQHFKYKF